MGQCCALLRRPYGPPLQPCVPDPENLPGGDTEAGGCADGLPLRFDAQLQPCPHFPACQLVTFASGVLVRPLAFLCPDSQGHTSLPAEIFMAGKSHCHPSTPVQGPQLKTSSINDRRGQGRYWEYLGSNKQSLLGGLPHVFQWSLRVSMAFQGPLSKVRSQSLPYVSHYYDMSHKNIFIYTYGFVGAERCLDDR